MTRKKVLVFHSNKDLYKYTKNLDTYYYNNRTIKGLFLARDPDAILILTELGQQIRIL